MPNPNKETIKKEQIVSPEQNSLVDRKKVATKIAAFEDALSNMKGATTKSERNRIVDQLKQEFNGWISKEELNLIFDRLESNKKLNDKLFQGLIGEIKTVLGREIEVSPSELQEPEKNLKNQISIEKIIVTPNEIKNAIGEISSIIETFSTLETQMLTARMNKQLISANIQRADEILTRFNNLQTEEKLNIVIEVTELEKQKSILKNLFEDLDLEELEPIVDENDLEELEPIVEK